jgi:phosphotransferase system enzyme I (PtsI)
MLPLISGVAELRAVRQICTEVCADLAREGVPHNPAAPLGVMIETPSAALIADLLAEECDFLSIGTNDLIQYSLAADRQDEHVGYLYHPLHPAILRILELIVRGAARVGRPLAMCGDMAGDPMLTWILLGLGLRDLSMAPRQVPLVKAIVRATRLDQARELCADVMALHTELEVEDRVYSEMRRRFPEELVELDDESGGDA